ncbi:MAG: FAD-binding oxidoreductase, partial [Solirubrobacterales bacterium]|nr:FAD-binding oxidoreductase [Solirubrobacterales bacterium]
MPDSYEMPTWGWGDPAHSRDLSDSVRARLQTQLGVGNEVEAVAREEAGFNVQDSLLDERLLRGLSDIVGEGNLRSDKMFRVLRSAGKSYPDMISLRGGEPGDVPDAVVQPVDQASLSGVLTYCSENAIAVTPFGGGTSVVGGLATVREGFSGAISVDLTNLSGLTSLDADSGLATFAGGTRGPAAEQLLADHQLTIGHFPQSFEYGTVGGFVATRSAGQSSTGYGRIDKNVIGLTAATPTGPVRFAPMPGTAAGPDLRQLLTGSEGSMGIIDTVTLQVKKAPDVLLDRAWMAPDFATGRTALRELEKAGCAPDVARLSDESETEVSLLLAGDSRTVKALR